MTHLYADKASDLQFISDFPMGIMSVEQTRLPPLVPQVSQIQALVRECRKLHWDAARGFMQRCSEHLLEKYEVCLSGFRIMF